MSAVLLSSAQSEASADECKIVAPVQSARALAPDTAASQSLAGVVERIVRPMLATPTLTEEVQPYFCGVGQERREFDKSKLTSLARLWITRQRVAPVRYTDLSGLDWNGTTLHARVAATTAVSREEAVRREVAGFSQWLEDRLYITVGDYYVEVDRGSGREKSMLEPMEVVPKSVLASNLLAWLLRLDEDYDDPENMKDVLYELYRMRDGVALLSQPALVDMLLLVSGIVSSVLDMQVLELSERQKKRALDDALTRSRTVSGTKLYSNSSSLGDVK